MSDQVKELLQQLFNVNSNETMITVGKVEHNGDSYIIPVSNDMFGTDVAVNAFKALERADLIDGSLKPENNNCRIKINGNGDSKGQVIVGSHPDHKICVTSLKLSDNASIFGTPNNRVNFAINFPNKSEQEIVDGLQKAIIFADKKHNMEDRPETQLPNSEGKLGSVSNVAKGITPKGLAHA